MKIVPYRSVVGIIKSLVLLNIFDQRCDTAGFCWSGTNLYAVLVYAGPEYYCFSLQETFYGPGIYIRTYVLSVHMLSTVLFSEMSQEFSLLCPTHSQLVRRLCTHGWLQ